MITESSVQNPGAQPAADYDAIAAVIQLYIDGLEQADVNKLRECFTRTHGRRGLKRTAAWCSIPSRRCLTTGPVTRSPRAGRTASCQ
jgi:hypothetical protein